VSRPGENSSRRPGEIVEGAPFSACSVDDSSVPSPDGDVPWKILPASDLPSRSKVYYLL